MAGNPYSTDLYKGEKRMSYFRVNDKCNGCLACVQNCPANALDSQDSDRSRTLFHNMSKCARCGNCWRICPQDAIEFQYILENQWDEVVQLELVRCQICNEPLFTHDFEKTIANKLDKDPEPICSRHKGAIDAMSRAYFLRSKTGPKR